MFDLLAQDNFEQVVHGYDERSGLKAIIAIHDTTLGPSMGGTRMMVYESEETALKDCLKLARAMTFKNAAGGIDYGGGKAVIIGDSEKIKNEDLLRAFGRLIDSLGGRYITGVDIGTDEQDMTVILKETAHTVALPSSYGGVGSTSGATAFGLYHGMKAASQVVFGSSSLAGKSIAVQGVGSVGAALAKRLVEEGAEIFVTDVSQRKLDEVSRQMDVNIVAPEEIYRQEVDIFSPCALGGVLNDDTIPELKCKLVAGAANNQLADVERHGNMLKERGIVYGVDYIMSAGGVIANTHQFVGQGYDQDRAYTEVKGNISRNIKYVIELAETENITTDAAAKTLVEQRLASAKERKSWYLEKER